MINSGIIKSGTPPVVPSFDPGAAFYIDRYQAGVPSATIVNLVNDATGTITGSGDAGIHNLGIIGTLTNQGVITGATYDIDTVHPTPGLPGGQITTLNNFQGATGSAGRALTYNGNLPTFYNIIISGAAYGQLSVTNAGSSATTFGISPLSTNIRPGTYASVLTGVDASNLTNGKGTITLPVGARGTAKLVQEAGSTTTWDLIISGHEYSPFLGFDDPNVVSTYTAVASNRDGTLNVMHQRYAILNAAMEYDCNHFDKYGVCISIQARATGFGAQSTGSGVANVSYRVADKVRVGAYLDYQAAQGNPFGINLATGSVQTGVNQATFGGYVGYGETDGAGLQAKVSGGYNPGQVNVVRAVLAGTEPGVGNAGLNAAYVTGVAGYGVQLTPKMVVTPYGGLRYTDVTRNGYTELYNPTFTLFPLAYGAFYERLITGTVGARVKSHLTDRLTVQCGLGAEFDFSRNASSYGGTSYVPGMEFFGVAHGGAWNGARPNAFAGASYEIAPNQRITLNGYAGQQAWSSRTYTTGMLGYQVAF